MRIVPLIFLCVLLQSCMTHAQEAETPYQSWLNALRQEALEQGIRTETLDRALTGVKPLKRVIDADKKQPEFTQTYAYYMNRAISEKRIARGRALLRKHTALLNKITHEFGVPGEVLMAFWGLETNFGDYFGKIPLVAALVTLAYDKRRADFFRAQLLSVLTIMDRGDLPTNVQGSWAGAMGHFQFIPTTYAHYAIDYDGDGKRDLWNSLPDAFASAANYLKNVGWKSQETWGHEVILPENFDYAALTHLPARPLTEWARMGLVRAVDTKPLPALHTTAQLLMPAGHQGPIFLVYDNFHTIMRWNRALFYATAVGHLADRINGSTGFHTPPPDEQPLAHAQIKTIQRSLNRLGYAVGKADGIIGPKTKQAIRAFQHAQGAIPDGHPTPALGPMLERILETQ